MHLLKLLHYINDRGGKAIIPAFKQPPLTFDNIQKLFELVYEHEKSITVSINKIVEATFEAKDFTTFQWIQWYVLEQIEEEKTASEILDKLKLLVDKNYYQFDKDLPGMRAADNSGK